MSNGKKQQKKRKRQSSPFKSQIARRLEKLRGRRRDLWGDDDDDDDNKRPYIAFSDSDEQRPSSSKRRSRSVKLRNQISQNHVKNPTCLICSILSQLSSYNCCSEHLSILKNHSHHHQQQRATNSQWLPEQVMILPITDDIVQRYLDPQQIHHLRAQTSTSPANKNTSQRNLSTGKSLNKSTTTLDHSESPQPTKKISKSSTKSAEIDMQPLASTIVVESTPFDSASVPPDITTITTVASTSIINTVDDITIDDTEQENTLIQSNNDKKQLNPWTSVSDETDAALDQKLGPIDISSDIPLEFTPTTVRRTATEIMAARLPKLRLNSGRFRFGKPIVNRTISNAANEYRPSAAAQSSSGTSSVITTSVRSPPTTTNVENESSNQNQNRPENIIDNYNDNIFTQDETHQLPTITLSNEETEINETQDVTSSTTNEKLTPSRISYRLNPDGTRVSISRPPLPTNPQSPLLSSLRRTSTDVTPIQSNTKQV